MKYIDSEKLRLEVEKLYKQNKCDLDNGCNGLICYGYDLALSDLQKIIPSLQQEQLEVDLEKVLSGFIGRYAHENSGEYPSAIDIARYFYEFGLNAKK